MTDNHDIPKMDDAPALEDATPEELHEASRLASSLDALEAGRRGLDDLPNLDDDAPADADLLELISFSQLLRNTQPQAHLSDARLDELWSTLEPAIPTDTASPSRRRLPWRWLIAGFAGALAAAFIAVFAIGLGTQPPPLDTSRGPMQPVALLEVEQDQARYATELLKKAPAPTGDTRLRSLRQARFDAYRSDVQRHRRSAPGDAP